MERIQSPVVGLPGRKLVLPWFHTRHVVPLFSVCPFCSRHTCALTGRAARAHMAPCTRVLLAAVPAVPLVHLGNSILSSSPTTRPAHQAGLEWGSPTLSGSPVRSTLWRTQHRRGPLLLPSHGHSVTIDEVLTLLHQIKNAPSTGDSRATWSSILGPQRVYDPQASLLH